jgi:CAAX prenyl protease-like protein
MTAAPPENAPAPVDHGPDRPWLACVVPLVVYLATGALETVGLPGGYPLAYALRIVATGLVLAWAWPAIRAWVGRPTWWPPLVGLGLVIPWIVLAALQRDLGWGGVGRAGYDPFAALGPGAAAWAFLALRFLGLVVVVPLAEELFLRGFLLRFVERERFWEVPFGLVTPVAAGACALYAALSHPAEAVAAVGWFAIVSGIAAATRRPIDCILCHAATNLALGGYVLASGAWWLL